MPEKNESLLGILSNYFSNLEEAQVIEGTTTRIIVPMAWFSAIPKPKEEEDKNPKEKNSGNKIQSVIVDSSIINEAFIKLILRASKDYKANLKKFPKKYATIEYVELEITEKGVNLVVVAPDKRGTKIVVTGDKTLRGLFYSVGEEGLYEEVLREYNFRCTGQSAQDTQGETLTAREVKKSDVYTKLNSEENAEIRIEDIKASMTKIAKNLIEYYEFMSRMHIKYQASSGVIQQRKGEGHRGAKKGNITAPRVSEIYNFEDREKILQEMHPCNIINIHNIESDNSVTKFAYITYVYQNPRDRQGYLLVAEPFEGNHNTRVRFVSQEEYDKLQVAPETDKLVYFAERTTEMSNDEFSQTRFCKTFKHTTMEEFRRKFRRIILGEKAEEAREEPRYKEADQIIFDGKKRKTIDEIRTSAKSATVSEVAGARTELYGREEQVEEKREQGEEPSGN